MYDQRLMKECKRLQNLSKWTEFAEDFLRWRAWAEMTHQLKIKISIQKLITEKDK